MAEIVIEGPSPEKVLEWKVKHHQKLTIPPRQIAEMNSISLEKVCEILGYDIERVDDDHKDYCFFNHGYPEQCFDIRMEMYGLFLEDGDFEKWQPVCYMDKTSEEYIKLHEEAKNIEPSTDLIKEIRRTWILFRFPEYQSEAWSDIHKKLLSLTAQVPEMVEISVLGGKLRLENRKISELFE